MLLDHLEIFEHAHPVLGPVPPVQLCKTPAGVFLAGMAIPVAYLFTGIDRAVPPACTVRGIASIAMVLLPEVCHADGAVHPAGSNKSRPERIPLRHQICFSIQTISKKLPRFFPTFLNRPHSENPFFSWNRMLPSFREETLARITEIPFFLHSVSR